MVKDRLLAQPLRIRRLSTESFCVTHDRPDSDNN